MIDLATLKNQHIFVGVDTELLFSDDKKWFFKESRLKKKYGTEEIEGMVVTMTCIEDGTDYGYTSKGDKVENLVGSDVEVLVLDYGNLTELKFMDRVQPKHDQVVKTSVYRPNGAYRDQVSIRIQKLAAQKPKQTV